jgi:hypothetical protein
MKDKLILDTSALPDSDNVGAYLRDAAGNLLTSTLVSGKQSLDVNVSQSALPSGAATEATLATRASEATLATRASESTLATRASESTLLTRASETTVAAILADTATIDSQTLQISQDVASLKKIEDAAHVSGDAGVMALVVRSDAGGSLAGSDGDYAPLQVNAAGELRVSSSSSVPNSAVLATTKTVTTTSGALLASQLSSRKRLLIENLGQKTVFVGPSGVSDVNGFRVSPGSVLDLDLGPAVSVHAVCTSGTADVRVLEVA